MRGADYFGVAVPLGHAIGRVGCFVAGCCHGRAGHPVQLYEAAGLLGVAAFSRSLLTSVESGASARGTVFRGYLIAYALLRIALDPFRGDGRPERFAGISHQQGIAIAVLVLALAWAAIARADAWTRRSARAGVPASSDGRHSGARSDSAREDPCVPVRRASGRPRPGTAPRGAPRGRGTRRSW